MGVSREKSGVRRLFAKMEKVQILEYTGPPDWRQDIASREGGIWMGIRKVETRSDSSLELGRGILRFGNGFGGGGRC